MEQRVPVLVMAAQPCWRCGGMIPTGHVCRRVMVTGTSRSSSYGTGFFLTTEARREVVSLCPRCNEDVEWEEAQQRQRSITRQRYGWNLIGGTLLTVLAAKSGVPWWIGAGTSGVLALCGVVGRTLVVLGVVAQVLGYLGHNTNTHPEMMAPYFFLTVLVIPAGTVLWRCYRSVRQRKRDTVALVEEKGAPKRGTE